MSEIIIPKKEKVLYFYFLDPYKLKRVQQIDIFVGIWES